LGKQGRQAPALVLYTSKEEKTMRFIPTRFHGILDYVVGLLLFASPWLLGFSDIEAATWAVIIAGAVVLPIAKNR
jgi:hypothetical protein